jgi:hypothetical protein
VNVFQRAFARAFPSSPSAGDPATEEQIPAELIQELPAEDDEDDDGA